MQKTIFPRSFVYPAMWIVFLTFLLSSAGQAQTSRVDCSAAFNNMVAYVNYVHNKYDNMVPQALPPDASPSLNFTSIAQKRTQIISAIWNQPGLPTGTNVVAETLPNSPLALSNLQSAQKLKIYGNYPSRPRALGIETAADNGFLFRALNNRNNRLIIVNPGHNGTFADNTQGDNGYRWENVINNFLQQGFDVLAIYMPYYNEILRGLNGNYEVTDHCQVINRYLGSSSGIGEPPAWGLRFFLEPTIVAINYYQYQYTNISMVGLSGGGWTVSLLAAIDPRIKTSIDISGSMPIGLRWGQSVGDIEQYLPGFYYDKDNFDGTNYIANYADLYVLGAAGTGRKQVQIVNRFDSCCFGQDTNLQYNPARNYTNDLNAYAQKVRDKLYPWGYGNQYKLLIDNAAGRHQISRYTLDVVLKELSDPAVAYTNLVLTSATTYRPDHLTPGSIAVVWGQNMSSTTAYNGSGATTLGGTQVFFKDVTGNETPAILYYVSPGQINLQVPNNIAIGVGPPNGEQGIGQVGAIGQTVRILNLQYQVIYQSAAGQVIFRVTPGNNGGVPLQGGALIRQIAPN